MAGICTAALRAAHLGASLVLVCRDEDQLETSPHEVCENPNGGRWRVRIPVALDNAAVYEFSRKATVDGIETVFAVNHPLTSCLRLCF
jgi:hypothetical protein